LPLTNPFSGSFYARRVALLEVALSGRAIIATAQSSSTFTTTGSMMTARSQHTATLLPNGKVLIAGGARSTSLSGADSRDCYVPNVGCILASAELFDPGPGTFSRTGDMTTARRVHTATLLADGRILIAGGYGTGGAPMGAGSGSG
jgi:hypothetical protein